MPTKMELQERIAFLAEQNVALRRHHVATQKIATAIDVWALDCMDSGVSDWNRLRDLAECLRDLMDTANQSGEQVNVSKEGGVAVGLARVAWIIDHGSADHFFHVHTLGEIALRRMKAGTAPLALAFALDPDIDRQTQDLMG